MLQLVDALGAFVTADTDPNVITKMAAFLLQGENVKLTGKFTAGGYKLKQTFADAALYCTTVQGGGITP